MAMLALVATLMAVGLSKVVPDDNGGHRKFVEPRYVGVNGSIFTPPRQENYLLDRETGRLTRSPLENGKHGLDCAVFAPWKGERGEVEVAGRLIERIAAREIGVGIPVGLARGGFPSGNLIDAIELDAVMAGSPCWLPGARRRVVFPAGGQLYLQEFPEGFEEPSPPRKILADSAFPDADLVVFNDVLSPTIPEYGGRLLVSIRFKQYEGKRATLSPSQIWSIKLDPSRAAMISAERMLDASDAKLSDSLPNVVRTAEGRHVMAFLSRGKCQKDWTLMLAPVEFDALTRVPVAIRAEAIKVADDCVFNRPEFSIDGRWTYPIGRAQSPSAALERIPVIETLDGGKEGL